MSNSISNPLPIGWIYIEFKSCWVVLNFNHSVQACPGKVWLGYLTIAVFVDWDVCLICGLT